MIWMNPFFQSPDIDNGYDVSDYRAIQPEFGTMEDFEALLKGLHERNIKFIIDMVANHSSDHMSCLNNPKVPEIVPTEITIIGGLQKRGNQITGIVYLTTKGMPGNMTP